MRDPRIDDILFEQRIHHNDETGCWEWTGATWGGKHSDGKYKYGAFRRQYAHRWAYERWKGPIPPKYAIDHLCLNTRCVNPVHLEAVTHQENDRRKKAKITQCPAGHSYDEANTHIDRNGARRCRTCNREHVRALNANQSPEARERRLEQQREYYARNREYIRAQQRDHQRNK